MRVAMELFCTPALPSPRKDAGFCFLLRSAPGVRLRLHHRAKVLSPLGGGAFQLALSSRRRRGCLHSARSAVFTPDTSPLFAKCYRLLPQPVISASAKRVRLRHAAQ